MIYLVIKDSKNSEEMTITGAVNSLEIARKEYNNISCSENSCIAIIELLGRAEISPGDIYWRIHGNENEQKGFGFSIIESK